MNLHEKATVVVADFLKVAELAGISMRPEELAIEVFCKPHRPPQLPARRQSVYAFFHGERCLKVGKAGPKSLARYNSQHYGANAPSTLAKSIVARQVELGTNCLDFSNIADWMYKELDRVSFLIPHDRGPFALALLEAFVQCRFHPVFEGPTRLLVVPVANTA